MGLSQEQWDKLCAGQHGVEIKKVYHGPYHEECWTLYVDGEEVWVDGASEPEDICLSRDLADFVYAIKKLAEERDALREKVAALEARALEASFAQEAAYLEAREAGRYEKW